MTMAQLEKRLAALEAEVRTLRAQFDSSEPKSRSWTDLFGKYAGDPAFEEATRLGREERERINRESLAEFDREEEPRAKSRKKAKNKPKPAARGANGRH
jgi:hypothetical protein